MDNEKRIGKNYSRENKFKLHMNNDRDNVGSFFKSVSRVQRRFVAIVNLLGLQRVDSLISTSLQWHKYRQLLFLCHPLLHSHKSLCIPSLHSPPSLLLLFCSSILPRRFGNGLNRYCFQLYR